MNRIEQLMTEMQDRQARAYANLATLREVGSTILAVIDASPEDVYWSIWMGFNGSVTMHRAMFSQGSIMLDSEVAAELERLEAAFAGDFTSVVDTDDGTIRYEMEVPGVTVSVVVYLLEQGECRRVVTGYTHSTEVKQVDVEVAKPIYGIVCGD